MVQSSQETLAILELGYLTRNDSVKVSELLRLKDSDFHNARRNHRKQLAHNDADCWRTLKLMEKKFDR